MSKQYSVGDRIGCLEVIGFDRLSIRGRNLLALILKCDCGRIFTRPKRDITVSTGKFCRNVCPLKIKYPNKNNRLYKVWQGIRTRCFNANDDGYRNYGGRGITLCKEWQNNFQKFQDWALDNGYANNLSIDRINNNGNYTQENCRWATQKQQSNNKRTNRLMTAWGETKNIKMWSEDPRCNVTYSILKDRVIDSKWDDETMITLPNQHQYKFEAFNELKTLKEWSLDSRCIAPYNILRQRIRRQKWNVEISLTTPLIKGYNCRLISNNAKN